MTPDFVKKTSNQILGKGFCEILAHKNLLIFSIFVSCFLFFNFGQAEAESTSKTQPKILIPGDIYVQSKVPTTVSYNIKALDDSGKLVPVVCDKASGSLFNVGKTTVRCMTTEPKGNEARKSFVITVGYEIVRIPDWLKQTTSFWASNRISDQEYVDNLKFLLENKIIHVPYSKPAKINSDLDFPVWIKDNAKKWTEGKLSKDEFSINIQWMLERGIIKF